jgi:hypothetical protein
MDECCPVCGEQFAISEVITSSGPDKYVCHECGTWFTICPPMILTEEEPDANPNQS